MRAANFRLTADRTLDDMERAGVATSVLPVTTPAVSFVDPGVALRAARESNEWVAGLRRKYPSRFGFFAMLPLQDIDGSLREIEYALETLGAACGGYDATGPGCYSSVTVG